MKKVDLILILSIFAGVLVICSALAQHFKEKRDKIELEKKDAEIKKLLYENYNSVQKLNEVQAELVEASKKNAALNEEMNNYLTGGDSRPTLSLWFSLYKTETGFDDRFSSLGFSITNKGKYPLRTIRFTIYDNTKNVEKVISKDENIIRTENSPNVNSWTEDWAKTVEIETLPNAIGYKDLYSTRFLKDMEKFHYLIEIQWMNGQLTYSIDGRFDKESDRMLVTKITVQPIHTKINPLEYVEVNPKNVGVELEKYKNPLVELIPK